VSNPPPDVAAAAAKVQAYLDGQPPQKASEEQYSKMSPAQRLDYVRQFPQPSLEDGRRK
jgi:hypothetical protein